jgi:hypothetical protein
VGEQGGEGRRVFTWREAGGCERCACGCVALSTAVVRVASAGTCVAMISPARSPPNWALWSKFNICACGPPHRLTLQYGVS